MPFNRGGQAAHAHGVEDPCIFELVKKAFCFSVLFVHFCSTVLSTLVLTIDY